MNTVYRYGRYLLCVALVLMVGLSAAQKKPDHLKYSKNDEMPRPSDVGDFWTTQHDDIAPSSTEPFFSGAYLWRGRADRNYMAFHQWEIRIATSVDVAQLSMRIITLGADMKPLLGKKGHWVELGKLAADQSRNCSYKLNTSRPALYRVELQWTGGKQSFLAESLGVLPKVEAPADGGPRLVVVQPDFEHDARRGLAVVTFILRNIGGSAATGVEHEVSFRNSKGKVVHRASFIPRDGVIEAGFAESMKHIFKKVPAFSKIDIRTKQNGGSGKVTIDPGVFTNHERIEIAELSISEEKVTAKVRNGFKESVDGLIVTLQFYDASDSEITSKTIAVGHMDGGAIQSLDIAVSGLAKVASWGVGFEMGSAGAEGGGSALADQFNVDGIQLKILEKKETAQAVKLLVEVTNKRGVDITGLVCILSIGDGKKSVDAKVKVGKLAIGKSWKGSVIALGVTQVLQIGMTWSTGK